MQVILHRRRDARLVHAEERVHGCPGGAHPRSADGDAGGRPRARPYGEAGGADPRGEPDEPAPAEAAARLAAADPGTGDPAGRRGLRARRRVGEGVSFVVITPGWST